MKSGDAGRGSRQPIGAACATSAGSTQAKPGEAGGQPSVGPDSGRRRSLSAEPCGGQSRAPDSSKRKPCSCSGTGRRLLSHRHSTRTSAQHHSLSAHRPPPFEVMQWTTSRARPTSIATPGSALNPFVHQELSRAHQVGPSGPSKMFGGLSAAALFSPLQAQYGEFRSRKSWWRWENIIWLADVREVARLLIPFVRISSFRGTNHQGESTFSCNTCSRCRWFLAYDGRE